jgi:hypothetical protein
MEKTKKIKRSESKDTLQFFTANHDWQTVYPDFNFQTCLDFINNDPIARGAINHFVDKCNEGSYTVIREEDSSYDKSFELLLNRKYRFRTEILRKIFLMGKLFNNAFVEIVRDTAGLTKSLNVLNTTNIMPITQPNGDPISFQSKIPNPTEPNRAKTYAKWDKSEITWFKFGDRTEGMAPVDLRALYNNLVLKDFILRYVGWLWQTGQYRVLYNFENADRQGIDDFMSYVKKSEENFKVPYLLKGKAEVTPLRDMSETTQFMQLLKYVDGQTLSLLGVSPIDVGIPDASGRANSGAQTDSSATNILAFKNIVQDVINFDLFPKMNKSNNLLVFSGVDRYEERMILENVQMMKSAGFTNDACKEYMQDKGLFFGAEEVFEEVVSAMDLAETKTMANPRDKDSAPSRAGKGIGEGNTPQMESTTREDQLD